MARAATETAGEGPVRLGPGMGVVGGGANGAYRVTHSCGWQSRAISPKTHPDDWRHAIEHHVCAPLDC